MVNALNNWLFRHASSGKIILAFIVAIASLLFMALIITPAFESVTNGLRPFDLNFNISASQMYADLPAYTDESRLFYLGFAIVDYIYPAAVALFFGLLWAKLFAGSPNRAFTQLTSYGIFLVPCLYMLVDWAENAGFLFIIFSYPDQYPGVGNIAGALKATKPMVMNVMLTLTVLFAIAVSGQRLIARGRGHEATGGNDAN